VVENALDRARTRFVLIYLLLLDTFRKTIAVFSCSEVRFTVRTPVSGGFRARSLGATLQLRAELVKKGDLWWGTNGTNAEPGRD
jgi:hypothetical protein